ncbi:copia protein [Tanacetum coccineum]
MEDDMVKVKRQLVDILCNLQQIYPPAFFDIMIHLVIHLPQEALESGHVPYRWIYPFERYMKKLKNYVRNKAKPEEDDHDLIHDNNSSDLALSTSLNDLNFATLNIDGQSMDVEASPDTIDVDKDDDFINDEDDTPHELANFDDEVFANDDDVAMLAAVTRGHGGDSGGDDPSRPSTSDWHRLLSYHLLEFVGVGGQKATKGGRGGGRKGTRKETRNIRLKKVTDEYGPLKIRFKFNDKGTMLHLGENYAWWSNLVGELIREYPMQRARSSAGRDPAHWLSSEISSSETCEYPSLIQTFFDTHTYGGEFLQDEAREEMLRLRDLGANTPMGVPYTEDQIMAMVRKGKQQGYILGVGRVLAEQGWDAISINEPQGTYTDTDVDELKEEAKRTRRELELLRRVVRCDDRMSQMYTQLDSQHEISGGSESGGDRGGDEDVGEDEDTDEDEEI